jgi:KUP system potassium uptake protein
VAAGGIALAKKLERDTLPLQEFVAGIHNKAPVVGTAVYMTGRTAMVPVPLLHNLKHNKVLHQRIVLLRVVTERIPRVRPENRIEVVRLGDNSTRWSLITASCSNRMSRDCWSGAVRKTFTST